MYKSSRVLLREPYASALDEDRSKVCNGARAPLLCNQQLTKGCRSNLAVRSEYAVLANQKSRECSWHVTISDALSIRYALDLDPAPSSSSATAVGPEWIEPLMRSRHAMPTSEMQNNASSKLTDATVLPIAQPSFRMSRACACCTTPPPNTVCRPGTRCALR